VTISRWSSIFLPVWKNADEPLFLIDKNTRGKLAHFLRDSRSSISPQLIRPRNILFSILGLRWVTEGCEDIRMERDDWTAHQQAGILKLKDFVVCVCYCINVSRSPVTLDTVALNNINHSQNIRTLPTSTATML